MNKTGQKHYRIHQPEKGCNIFTSIHRTEDHPHYDDGPTNPASVCLLCLPKD